MAGRGTSGLGTGDDWCTVMNMLFKDTAGARGVVVSGRDTLLSRKGSPKTLDEAFSIEPSNSLGSVSSPSGSKAMDVSSNGPRSGSSRSNSDNPPMSISPEISAVSYGNSLLAHHPARHR